jgi:hypothetical protein
MRYQGVLQIVRFNWPFYAYALAVAVGLLGIYPLLPPLLQTVALAGLGLGLVSIILSLVGSWYAYDYSKVYDFSYLDLTACSGRARIANMHAGFDQSSASLARCLPEAELDVFDFYNPEKHTEGSIRRARASQEPAFPTIPIRDAHVPVGDDTYDAVFLIFAAHEMRQHAERIAFFRELRVVSKPDASVYVVEHLRDWRNALVYSFGCLHFHSASVWQDTFAQSGWRIVRIIRPNALVIAYQLKCNFTST